MTRLSIQGITVLFLVLVSGARAAETKDAPETAPANPTNFVGIVEFPKDLHSRSPRVKVAYHCEGDAVVLLQVNAMADGSSAYTPVYNKAWKCKGQGLEGSPKSKSVKIRLPKSIKYRPDYFNREYLIVRQMKLKASLYTASGWQNRLEEKPRTISQSQKRVQVLPPLSRRFFSPKCRTWLWPLLQRSWRFSDSQKCPLEQERMVLLDYPAVFNGFATGILRPLPSYSDKGLEESRVQRYNRPKLSIETWVYFLDYCPFSHQIANRVCGIVTHIDPMGNLLTPSLFVNEIGQIQIHVNNGVGPIGLKTHDAIPKNVWARIVFTMEGRTWNLNVHYGQDMVEAFAAQYSYTEDMPCDDTEGYFSIGGVDPHFGSPVGYIGKVVINRRRIVNHVELPRPAPFHPMFELHLTRREEKCRHFLSWLDDAIGVYRHYMDYTRALKRDDVCQGVSSQLISDWSNPDRELCPLRHPNRRKYYRHVSRFLRKAMRTTPLSQKFEGGDFEAYARQSGDSVGNRLAFLNISNGLMGKALSIVTTKGLKKANRMVPLLKQAACLGNDDAMFYMAVMLNNGVGIAANEIQSLAFYMLGTMNKHTLSSMAMGHRHMMGIDGAPRDLDMAFMYYRTAAQKTKDDREIHKDKEVVMEEIRLIDDAKLQSQTSEVGDIFMWLRNQAERGVASARSELAGMLYWGARGIQRNLENALNEYRAGAEQGNAESMFNYGIMQYRGQGAEANETEGKIMMQKAAKLKDVNAISALGWIALMKEGNMTEAHRLFQLARQMGHVDSGYYLGQMNYFGQIPNRTVDWDTALENYEWSAARHHMHAGIMTGLLLSRGTTRYQRKQELAADWVRFVAEKNSNLAQPLRAAVDAFRDGNTDLAVYLYLITADTGLEVASFNLAYLCELNDEGIASHITKECQWRHYNLTTQRHFHLVDSYSYIKMGDFHWYGCQGQRNMSEAARFYALAAKKKDPQALFNLAFMVEEGTPIAPSIWRSIPLSQTITQASNYTLLTELYSRCRVYRKSEAYIPCSLALARVNVLQFWNEYYVYMQITSFLGIFIVAVTIVFLLYHYIHLRRERRRMQQEEEEDRRAEEMCRRESEGGNKMNGNNKEAGIEVGEEEV